MRLPHTGVLVPHSPTPDDRRRALLLLFLLAREAGLPFEAVDSTRARATVVRGLALSPARWHRRSSGTSAQRWGCHYRKAAA